MLAGRELSFLRHLTESKRKGERGLNVMVKGLRQLGKLGICANPGPGLLFQADCSVLAILSPPAL